MNVNRLWREEEDTVQGLLPAQYAFVISVGTGGVAE